MMSRNLHKRWATQRSMWDPNLPFRNKKGSRRINKLVDSQIPPLIPHTCTMARRRSRNFYYPHSQSFDFSIAIKTSSMNSSTNLNTPGPGSYHLQRSFDRLDVPINNQQYIKTIDNTSDHQFNGKRSEDRSQSKDSEGEGAHDNSFLNASIKNHMILRENFNKTDIQLSPSKRVK